MMKKWMAALMSVVLAIGLSIPAFAEGYSDSGESGDPADITQLVFSASSFKVSRDQTLDLKDELTAYCGSKKICQFPDYEFSTDDSNLVFDVTTDGIVSVWEDSGSATVTVKELNSGKKATCRVVASKSSTSSSFRFEPTSYTLYRDAAAADQPELRVLAGSGSFTSTQRDEMIRVVQEAFSASAMGIDLDVVEREAYDGAIVFQPKDVSDLTVKSETISVEAQLRENSSAVTRKTIRVTVKDGDPAKKIASKGSLKLEIGKTADLYDYVNYNSTAAYGKECDFYLDLYSDNSDSYDYAVLGEDGHTIKGVSVGKLYAVATLRSNPNSTTKILVNVVAKGNTTSSEDTNSGDMSISPTSGTIRVGGTLLLTAKNVPDDSDVDWEIEDDAIASLTISNGRATVKGLKVGATIVTASVDGEQIGKAKITVSSAAVPSDDDENLNPGTTPSLPTPPVVINPATGDSWFSNLF